VVPDLIVEIISPSDRLTAVRRKVQQWLDSGARLAWTLNPRRRTVTVDTPGHSMVLHVGEILTGEPVLPEFSVPVAELFPE
jgi:Uma2 family endonuclease